MNLYLNPAAGGLFFATMILSGASAGAEVYKWIDLDGATHYSEMPPVSDLASVELLELEVADPVQSESPDYQSMLNVANSLEASRLERERLRLEKMKLRLKEQQARRPDPVPDKVFSGPVVAGYYYPSSIRPHLKHGHGGKYSRPGHGHEPGRGKHPRGHRPGYNSQGYAMR